MQRFESHDDQLEELAYDRNGTLTTRTYDGLHRVIKAVVAYEGVGAVMRKGVGKSIDAAVVLYGGLKSIDELSAGEASTRTVLKNGEWAAAENEAPSVVRSLKGPADYSHIESPKDVVKRTKPTPRQVREMKSANRLHNEGILRDDVTGEEMVDSSKSFTGVKPPTNEA